MILLLRGLRQMIPERGDAGRERGNARGEFAGIVRHAAARMLHAHPAILRLIQQRIERAQRATLRVAALLELRVEPPVQHALHQPDLVALDLHRIGVVAAGVAGRGLELPDLDPLRAFIRGAEGGDIVAGFDCGQPRINRRARRQQLRRRVAGQQRIGAREPFAVGLLAGINHGAVRLHALVPVPERAGQIPQIAVIFQTFLEIIVGQQAVEVARLRCVRQLLELPEPTLLAGLFVGAEQVVEHVAVADARDRAVEALRLLIERLDGGLVELRRLCIGVELAVSVRHRQVGFLHRGVEQIPVVQLGPRR